MQPHENKSLRPPPCGKGRSVRPREDRHYRKLWRWFTASEKWSRRKTVSSTPSCRANTPSCATRTFSSRPAGITSRAVLRPVERSHEDSSFISWLMMASTSSLMWYLLSAIATPPMLRVQSTSLGAIVDLLARVVNTAYYFPQQG